MPSTVPCVTHRIAIAPHARVSSTSSHQHLELDAPTCNLNSNSLNGSVYRVISLSAYRVISLLGYQLIGLSAYRVISLSGYQLIGLSAYRVISLLGYQLIGLSVSRFILVTPCNGDLVAEGTRKSFADLVARSVMSNLFRQASSSIGAAGMKPSSRAVRRELVQGWTLSGGSARADGAGSLDLDASPSEEADLSLNGEPVAVPGSVQVELIRKGLVPHPFYGANCLDPVWDRIDACAWTYECSLVLENHAHASHSSATDATARASDNYARSNAEASMRSAGSADDEDVIVPVRDAPDRAVPELAEKKNAVVDDSPVLPQLKASSLRRSMSSASASGLLSGDGSTGGSLSTSRTPSVAYYVLRFVSIDGVADVYIDDELRGSSENAFLPLEIVIPGDEVSSAGQLSVRKVTLHFRAMRLCGETLRKPRFSFGCEWAPRILTVGFLGSVLVDQIHLVQISDWRVTQKHEKDGKVVLHVEVGLECTRDVALRAMVAARGSSRVGEQIWQAAARSLSASAATNLDESFSVRATLFDGEELLNDLTSEGCVGNIILGLQATAASSRSSASLLLQRLVFRGSITIDAPKLWWPNGYGAQNLYTMEIAVLSSNGSDANATFLDEQSFKVGLRTITLDTSALLPAATAGVHDNPHLIVNGRAIIAKGAHVVPLNSFLTNVSARDYYSVLSSAQAVGMNVLRVSGAGTYERIEFYDIADKLGIMILQEFCSTRTGQEIREGDAVLSSIAREAQHQVESLRHHACLALWCSASEERDTATSPNGKNIPIGLLSAIVQQHDAHTPFCPSLRAFDRSMACPNLRTSQSLCSEDTVSAFAARGERSLFGPVMDAHQRQENGDTRMLEMTFRLFRFPKDFPSLAYLTQLCQAIGVDAEVQRLRREGHGVLYQQLNDCWPGTSSSSLEFFGRWKALHFFSMRFFAPISVCLQPLESDRLGMQKVESNHSESTFGGVFDVCIVNDHDHTGTKAADGGQTQEGVLTWRLWNISSSEVVQEGSESVMLAGTAASTQVKVLDFRENARILSHENLVLDVRMQDEKSAPQNQHITQRTAWFCPPRLAHLSAAKAATSVDVAVKDRVLHVTLRSDVFLAYVFVNVVAEPTQYCRPSNNFFDLFPNEPYTITVRVPLGLSLEQAKQRLMVSSLVDSYMH
ncbi:Beta-mannosidase [Porphyridium purpureum]|uniref:Beta-mannosidase B n=1 Tax=Porphyridium purpureum TaxID=35688 RepID=A0A5J4Z8J3_PORPP|nr:Beta-mannosidase [Porphyridium purpureum]|eukprot:POR2411..scf295_1